MNRSRLLPLAIALAAALVLVCGCPLAGMITITGANNASGAAAAFACPPATDGSTSTTTPSVAVTPVGRWDTTAVTNAAIIVKVGHDAKIPARGWVIAVATAMQETKLLNAANDNPNYPDVARLSQALPHDAVYRDHDSVGLFQQRPVEGDGNWGTVAELMHPPTAARKFYDALLKISGWQSMPLTDAAQAVQQSSFPGLYAQWEDDAEQVVAAVTGVADILDLPGAATISCGKPGAISTKGWTIPVPGNVGSPFGPRGGALHAGVDISPPRGTAIRAANAGTVIVAECNVSVGSCDQDGSPDIGGCGWFVDIDHGSGVVTRYCHMGRKPQVSVGQTVTAGQILGFVGSSGNSSGPHLHFEIHTGVPANGFADNSNATDPVPFMESVGARLGSPA